MKYPSLFNLLTDYFWALFCLINWSIKETYHKLIIRLKNHLISNIDLALVKYDSKILLSKMMFEFLKKKFVKLWSSGLFKF